MTLPVIAGLAFIAGIAFGQLFTAWLNRKAD